MSRQIRYISEQLTEVFISISTTTSLSETQWSQAHVIENRTLTIAVPAGSKKTKITVKRNDTKTKTKSGKLGSRIQRRS